MEKHLYNLETHVLKQYKRCSGLRAEHFDPHRLINTVSERVTGSSQDVCLRSSTSIFSLPPASSQKAAVIFIHDLNCEII